MSTLLKSSINMGIQNFHQILKSNYPDVYISSKNNVYDYIYIDLNYILHLSVYGAESMYGFKNRIIQNLNIIFSNYIPTKAVYLNIDGPSSYAKIALQKKRRMQFNTDYNRLVLGLTPGTNIMNTIEKWIEQYANQMRHSYKFINPQFFIETSAKPDEGEIKICRQIRINNDSNPNAKHLIIGSDSDLIVMSMALKPIRWIYLLIQSKYHHKIISTDILVQKHAEKVMVNSSEIYNHNARLDFALVSMFMGNDYFPKIAYVSSENLWNTYFNLFNYSNQNSTLITTNINTNSIDGQNNCTNLKYSVQMMTALLFQLYNSMKQQYKSFSMNDYSPKRCQNYLTGILWCLDMYNSGSCKQYDYIYLYDTPHPYELLLHINFNQNISIKKSPIQPIPIDTYPVMVLPYKAKELIPKKYHQIVEKELRFLYEIEECKICQCIHKDLSKIQGDLRKAREIKEDDSKLKKDYKRKTNEHSNHKMVHNLNFGIKEIRKVLSIIQSFESKKSFSK